MDLIKTQLFCQNKKCGIKFSVVVREANVYPLCEKCGSKTDMHNPHLTYKYDLTCINPDCKNLKAMIQIEVADNKDISELDPILTCDLCKKPLDYYWSYVNVGFSGFTTPGGNGSPSFKKLPSELQDWAKKRYDQDRSLNEQAKKPVKWPDGTVR